MDQHRRAPLDFPLLRQWVGYLTESYDALDTGVADKLGLDREFITALPTAGATTQDQKLRAIYAAVMKLENTDFTREHEAREDKAAGLGKVNNVGDVLRDRGLL